MNNLSAPMFWQRGVCSNGVEQSSMSVLWVAMGPCLAGCALPSSVRCAQPAFSARFLLLGCAGGLR